jgi:hypothetical protein
MRNRQSLARPDNGVNDQSMQGYAADGADFTAALHQTKVHSTPDSAASSEMFLVTEEVGPEIKNPF